MRILLDLQGMQNGSRQRGIGRYVASLAKGLARIAAAQGVTLRFIVSDLFPDHVDDVITQLLPLVGSEAFVRFVGVGPVAELDQDNAWRRHASELLYQDFVARLAPDVLLLGSVMEGATDNSIAAFPPEPRGYVVGSILYDLIPLISPDLHLRSPAQKRWYQRRLDLLASSNVLLAISASARQEGISYAGIAGEMIFNIGAAAGEIFGSDHAEAANDIADLSDAAICRYYGISRSFVLFTSAFDARKNFEGLIRAFAVLPDALRAEHQLVLVCKLADHQRRDLVDLIASCGLREGDEVILTGYVPDGDLRALYRECRLFVFPSFHEGFGLPALEAMWCGAVTIGSSISSIPEVIGREDALFDPHDQADMVACMSRALVDGPFRETLAAHCQTQCRRFSWNDVGERAVSALRQVSRGLAAPTALAEDDLIEQLVAWDNTNGPSATDLAQVARAIDTNRRSAAAPWPSVEEHIYAGLPLAGALR